LSVILCVAAHLPDALQKLLPLDTASYHREIDRERTRRAERRGKKTWIQGGGGRSLPLLRPSPGVPIARCKPLPLPTAAILPAAAGSTASAHLRPLKVDGSAANMEREKRDETPPPVLALLAVGLFRCRRRHRRGSRSQEASDWEEARRRGLGEERPNLDLGFSPLNRPTNETSDADER
jgi:hypothetical protein